MIRLITATFIGILFSLIVDAQELYLDAHVDRDSIIFRWAPTDMEIFESGVLHGYVLERIPWEGKQFQLVDTIFPASTVEAKRIFEQYPEDDAAAVAAYYLHNEQKNTTVGFDNIFEGYDHYNDRQLNYNFVLVSADLSPRAAKILGLQYRIPNMHKEEKSIYRLRSLGERKDSASYYYTGEYSFYPEIEHVEFVQNGKLLSMKWDNHAYQEYYSAYDVFRSTQRSGGYQKINQAPIFQSDVEASQVIFKDTVEIGQTYYYKIQGYSAFGKKSPIVKAADVRVLDQHVPFTITGMKARGNHESIEVEWQPRCTNPAKITNVFLLKSNSLEGPFAPIGKGIITSNTASFTDRKIANERTHYYRIAAQNRDGYWYHSSPIRAVYVDEVPPAVPTELMGDIDSSGVASIQWKANEEEDMKGYRVYKSNRKDGTYYHAHDLLIYTNAFVDTVGIDYLTEEVYYKVVALDYDNNHSDFSQLLVLNRPDLVLPVPAQIYDYEIIDEGLKLYLHNSPSIDVAKAILIKDIGDSTKIEELEIDRSQGFFIDQKFEKGIATKYTLRTIDDAGNSSEGKTITVNARNTKPPIETFSAQYREGEIVLEWAVSKDPNGMMTFYLQEKGLEEFTYLSKLSASTQNIALAWPKKGDYVIAAVFQNESGKQFPPIFSNPITIK